MAKHLATWCASVYRDSVLAIIAKRRTIVPLFGRRECSNEPTKLRIDDALMQAHVVAQELRGELFGGPKLVARILNGQAASLRQSLVPLVALTAIFAAGLSVLAARGVAGSQSTGLLWSFEFQLILTLWVLADRRNRGFRVPYEFNTFVFFAWPAVVPYYLYRSRGRRGLLLGAGVWALYIAPYVTALIVQIARNP